MSTVSWEHSSSMIVQLDFSWPSVCVSLRFIFRCPKKAYRCVVRKEADQRPGREGLTCTHTCKNLGSVESNLSNSLPPTPPLPPFLDDPLPSTSPRLAAAAPALKEIRRRTHKRVARAALARTAGLRWFPHDKNADSTRDSVAVATTSSTHWRGEGWGRGGGVVGGLGRVVGEGGVC